MVFGILHTYESDASKMVKFQTLSKQIFKTWDLANFVIFSHPSIRPAFFDDLNGFAKVFNCVQRSPGLLPSIRNIESPFVG
jgi:hypothetical protein